MPLSPRAIQALRSIAERGGTPAERALAKEKLAKVVPKEPKSVYRQTLNWVYFFYEGDGSDFEWPSQVQCRCGDYYAFGGRCHNEAKHRELHERLQKEFPIGTRVYYNKWAYEMNSPATVVAHCSMSHAQGGNMWGWIRLQFDHLKSRRSVPVYSPQGLHLSKKPLPVDKAEALIRAS